MKNDISRRKFLWTMLAGLGAFFTALVGIPVAGFVLSPVFKKNPSRWVHIAWLEDLKSNGPQDVEFKLYKQDAWLNRNVQESVYVIKKSADKFVVMSRVCTHLGCSVHWDPDKQRFLCPCHGGQYDINGNVVAGPPPRPLTRFETKIEKDQLYIKET